MSMKQNILCGAVLVCLSGFMGSAQAIEAKTASVAKTSSKVSKPATASKSIKSAKSKSVKTSKVSKSAKRVKTASKAVAAAPVATAYPAANPYLVNHPVNPFFASQASNPYLAYRYEKPVQAPQSASATAYTRPVISKVSFAPMPVTMYLQPNQKPTMAIATPCSAMEQMTGHNPMFKAMEQMAFGMIGKMNEAGFMPMTIEPVCT